MALYFLASIAGLFPGFMLPISVGWKAIHAFDVLFVLCLGFTTWRRAWRAPDWRLILSCAAVVAAGGVALWVHPSPEGLRGVIAVAYSMAVLVTLSHMRPDVVGVRVDHLILGPLLATIGIAWLVFLVENLTGIAIGRNQSAALPSGVHRLGGFTGANALILFICLGAPLVRAPWLIAGGVLLPALATLSRSMVGVGFAMVMHGRWHSDPPGLARPALKFGSWLCVALGLFAYAFALVPTDPTQRSTLRVSLDTGGYVTPHQAALRMFRASPLLGVGPAQFVERYRDFTSEEERNRLADHAPSRRMSHSAILGLAAEQGLLGLAAFGWLLYEIFVRLGRIEDERFRSAAIAGLVGVLIGGHFVDWLALKGLWFWIGLLVASRRVDTR